jgi:hypothetical protein
MTSKDIIRAHLTSNYINQNGLIYFSALCGGLKDSRKISGRHLDTGEKFSEDTSCNGDENGPCFKGHLGSWLGTMGYMAILDQIGKCYRPKSKTRIKNNSSAIIKCLVYFTSLSSDEINVLYALRNAFFHDYSISHKHNSNKYVFRVGHDSNAPILKPSTRPWVGSYTNINSENQTWVNLEAIGDLVERIYNDLVELASKDELEIELVGGADELFARYIFVTSEKVK